MKSAQHAFCVDSKEVHLPSGFSSDMTQATTIQHKQIENVSRAVTEEQKTTNEPQTVVGIVTTTTENETTVESTTLLIPDYIRDVLPMGQGRECTAVFMKYYEVRLQQHF